jgi:type IV secretory pathway VirD2 relaxase
MQAHQAPCAMCDCARQPANQHNSLELFNFAHLACACVMTRDDDLRVRLGRVRDRGRGSARRAKPFLAQALAAAEKAGGLHRRSGRSIRRTAFGRGRAASIAAVRFMSDPTRSVAVKARVVRHRARGAPLGTHLAYLRREGVTKDGTAGRMFDAEHDDSDHRAFADRCEGDRHHFRFIVSPEDAEQLSDLRAFTRDLMAQAEQDLGTKLDWIGVDHWNTDNPHIHVIVRGKGDDGRDLVIARDYISQGMRARAAHLATLELGPRRDLEIRRDLEAQVEADRWTKLDRALARQAAQHDCVIDLRPGADARVGGHARTAMVGRMQKLERLGLAEPLGPARWHLSENAEPVMRELGERSDIIKRIHRGLADQRIERSVADFALDGGEATRPIIGRLVARGLDDELKGTAYAVIDGVDGRAHHMRLADLDAASDASPGSIVELRQFDDATGRQRVALAVRSDLPLEAQVQAGGATWIDRQLVGRGPAPLSSGGFGREVRDAMDARVEHLVGQGFARRQGERVIFARDLLDTLRRRELEATAARIGSAAGLPYHPAREGEPVAGTYRQRLDLASGRFAMIDDGLEFSLVPWTPSLERQLGKQVSGIVRSTDSIEWSFGRKQGLGI